MSQAGRCGDLGILNVHAPGSAPGYCGIAVQCIDILLLALQ